MSKVSAFILLLTEKRYEAFLDSLREYGNFAEAVDEFSYSQYLPLIVLILTPTGRVSHIGQGRRGRRAGYGQRRLNVENLNPISKHVDLTGVLDALHAKFRQHAKRYFTEGGVLPVKTFQAVIDAISELAPEMAETLFLYSRLRRERLARLTSEERVSLAYQKDTVATALKIAGMDRSPLSMWMPISDEKPKSFLEGLPSTRPREDAMLIRDMLSVPGYDYLKTLPNQATAVFENEKGETLTVILANRQPLEEQTGADLIYFNERFRAFIFVQYKAMEKENGEAVFRYPDIQLIKEINRMNSMLLELQKVGQDNSRDGYRLNVDPFFLKFCPRLQFNPDSTGNSRDGYRLNVDPFFLKFCPRLQFNPDSTGLVRGMYLPLGYWKSTAEDPVMEGPKGGKHISYRNVGRYFDNSSFATIVSHAWVGTTIPQSKILEDYFKQVIADGRAITFAVKREEDSKMVEVLL